MLAFKNKKGDETITTSYYNNYLVIWSNKPIIVQLCYKQKNALLIKPKNLFFLF